jgi:hypothetical protein
MGGDGGVCNAAQWFQNGKIRLWIHETKVAGLDSSQSVVVLNKKGLPINADSQAHTKHTAPRNENHGIYGSRCREYKAGAHQCSKSYPQPCGDFCPKLNYLSGDVISASLPPHFATGLRRHSAIALRLGGIFFSLGEHLRVRRL